MLIFICCIKKVKLYAMIRENWIEFIQEFKILKKV